MAFFERMLPRSPWRIGRERHAPGSIGGEGRRFHGSGAEASRLCFDKVRAREIVGARGIRVAEAILLGADSGEALHRFLQRTGRLVVKPVADGSSHGIWFVSQERELEEAVRASKAPYIVERFIEGRELTVGVREQEGELSALPCSEVRLAPGRTFDFEGKYLGHGSEEITPAQVTPATAAAAQQVAREAHEATGCRGYSRTDVILSSDGPVFLEINTLPGLTQASFIPQQLEAGWNLDGELSRTAIEHRPKQSGTIGLADERLVSRLGSEVSIESVEAPGSRGASRAKCRAYSTEAQRSEAGCIGARMQHDFRDGALEFPERGGEYQPTAKLVAPRRSLGLP